MVMQIFRKTLGAITCILMMSAIVCCNPANKSEPEGNSVVITEGELENKSAVIAEKESIPDSIVQFLLHSASTDFREHQPPTPIDFRNLKIGYIKSPENQKVFLLCGEFLPKEDKKWTGFTTIKTSGYEQYIGDTRYCQDATMVLVDDSLSISLKNKLAKE